MSQAPRGPAHVSLRHITLKRKEEKKGAARRRGGISPYLHIQDEMITRI